MEETMLKVLCQREIEQMKESKAHFHFPFKLLKAHKKSIKHKTLANQIEALMNGERKDIGNIIVELLDEIDLKELIEVCPACIYWIIQQARKKNLKVVSQIDEKTIELFKTVVEKKEKVAREINKTLIEEAMTSIPSLKGIPPWRKGQSNYITHIQDYREILEDKKYIVLRAISLFAEENRFYLIETKKSGIAEGELKKCFKHLKKLDDKGKFYAGKIIDYETLYRDLRRKGIAVYRINASEYPPYLEAVMEKPNIPDEIIEKAMEHFEKI